MKKVIQIEIENTNSNILDITTSGILSIQNEVIKQCGISKEKIKSPLNINIKAFDNIDEQKLNELAKKYINFLAKVRIDLDSAEKLIVADAYCAGYRKAMEYLATNKNTSL